MRLLRYRHAALAVAIAVVWLLPMVWLLRAPSGLSQEASREVSLAMPALNSLLLSLASATAACLLGSCLAWLLEGVAPRWRTWWLALLCFPLLLPSYLIAIAWAPILSPTGIVVLPAASAPVFHPRGMLSAIWVQCCAWYPVALLVFHAAARLWSAKYEEASRTSGVSGLPAVRLRLRWYTWPAAAAFAIVSLLVLAEFAVADYFGVRTLGAEIFAIVSAYLD